MQLSKHNLRSISSNTVSVPGDDIFSLPEKVLQFGTGVLLRGLPDYFIDKANRSGLFNGRVVVVKSTSSGGTDEFNKQDNLYTICVRGIEDGQKNEEYYINSSISRVISAKDEWDTVLQCAHNPSLQIIISNTTEVGITLVEDDVRNFPPQSFPGKLLGFLLERYKAFNGSEESGMVIIPTELITDNGTKLRSILIELAGMNKLDEAFIQWLKTANHFCNSLVDRIVPGKLAENDKQATEKKLGYTDELMIMAETFRLWAIESGSQRVNDILSFAAADEGVVIAPDIEIFRELKLRLLNGTHTFSCGLAYLAGFKTVREAMSNPAMAAYIRNLAMNEIAMAMADSNISYNDACNFARKVMDRFSNPFLDHQWINITVQYSSKMKMRNVPLLLKHYAKNPQVPEHMALGFSAYLLFMKGKDYPVQDDHAAWIADKWKINDINSAVDAILSDTSFWGTDLSALNGFAEAVKNHLQSLMNNGAMTAIRNVELNKTVA